MCGIIGFSGRGNLRRIIGEGLRALEYRGYDSCGAALGENGILKVIKQVGPGGAGRLAAALPAGVRNIQAIGHTRWATHGASTAANAHPHLDCGRRIAVVHNGIIENHGRLRAFLQDRGHTFVSDTDTEVLPHLIEEYLKEYPFTEALCRALRQCQGTFALAVLAANGGLAAARRGLPLVVGFRGDNLYVASDYQAIPPGVRRQLELTDGEMLLRDDRGAAVRRLDTGAKVARSYSSLPPSGRQSRLQGYPHYMLKEIYQQPEVVAGAIHAFDWNQAEELGRRLGDRAGRRLIVAACGTSWHAGLLAKYFIEDSVGFSVEVDYASEFRYRKPVLSRGDMVLVISQSGETADTLAALQLARERQCRVAAVCNAPGSSIARGSDYFFYTAAGPEIGVASTKAFTTQVAVLRLLSLSLARMRGRLGKKELDRELAALKRIPRLMARVLKENDRLAEAAAEYAGKTNALYLGRGVQFPVALEGALKLKEISYIHAEGYPAAEMKHGPIALVDPRLPVVFMAVRDRHYRKILANIEEVLARGGEVLVVSDGRRLPDMPMVSRVISVPPAEEMLLPLLTVIPLQLLAYHVAVRKGYDVDKPRNLAKSVTVE